jgi:hypothetical protein
MTAFACPCCGKPLAIPDQREISQLIQCPHCRQRFALERSSQEKSPSSTAPNAETSAPLPPEWLPLEPSKEEEVQPSETPSFAAADTGAASPLDGLSPLGARATLNGLAARRRAAKNRRRQLLRLIIPGGVAAGIVLVAIVFVWDHFANRGDRATTGESRGSPASEKPRTQLAIGQQHQDSPALDHGPRPIRLLLAPAGVRMIAHLRPAKLWDDAARRANKANDPPNAHQQSSLEPTKSEIAISQGEELRRCLGPLSAWTERQIADGCLFPPSQIDEVLFSFVLRSPGDPPDVATTVWLKEATTVSEIAKRFGGQRREQGSLTICVKGDRALVIRDGRTFAIGPQAAAQEMADANAQPNPTDESIEELLKQTDRGREITFVFRPDDLDRFRESLFPPALQGVAHRVAGWLDPDATEGAVVSFHLADPFRIRLALRNRLATSVHHLEADVQQRLAQLPTDMLEDVKRLDPRTSGRRKLVGRVPAMWKAVALGTESTSQDRFVTFESVLPKRAAPNLSLGTYLALTETAFAASGSNSGRGRQTSPAEPSKTIGQRLAAKIDVDFRRTPLSEAFASIGEDIGVTFDVEGADLKIAGYTKNMPQTLRLTGVPAIEALRQITKPYAKMALIIDEPRQRVVVTTFEAAEAKGQKPIRLE